MALNTDSTDYLTVRRLWSIMSSFKDKIVTALSKKSDKPSTFTPGNVAEFDSNGNTVDSAIAADDVIVMKDALCNNGNNSTAGYFKFAEIDTTTSNHIQLSCDYVFGYKTMLVQGKMEVNVSNISSDWDGDASPFKVLTLEHLKGANATGIEIQGIATRSGTTMHVELWAKLTGEYRTLVVSRRFNKTLAATLSGSYWTFSSPSRTTTAPTVPSGGKSATATFRGTPSLRAVGTAYGNAGTPVYVTSGGLITACTVDSTPTASSTNLVTSGGVESSLALKENTANKTSFIRGLSEADHTRFPTEYATRLAIESTRSLIEKYLRVHCEGILGGQGWTSINLYSYDSNTPVINTPSGLGDNNFHTILYKEIDASHTWDPCSKGCEDFLVIKQGHQAKLTTYFQLGPIFELPQVRRFKMRLYNIEPYRWTVSICHTRASGGEYTGSIFLSTNKSGRFESNLDIIIEPKRCITIEVLISTTYYNDIGIPVVFVSTNEEIAS